MKLITWVKPFNRLIRVFTARKQPYLEFMMIFWERLKTTDLLPCYYLISWLPLIESTMEFCYIALNSALVLKAVLLVTREKKPHQTRHCLHGNYIHTKHWMDLHLVILPTLLTDVPTRSLRSSDQLFTESSKYKHRFVWRLCIQRCSAKTGEFFKKL